MHGEKLNLCVDLYGCPNRCLHCWLGHMPNRAMPVGADGEIAAYFAPYFDKIEFYSWLREPDFCADYRARWEKDKALSKNCAPERFELASFWRIVRDPEYIPFLREVGVKKVQLTLFGLRETQDRYIGRRGAYDEVLTATRALIAGGIVPRWQCFINEENKDEIVQVYRLAQKFMEECPEFEFFVHEGSCEGENEKLYPIRIEEGHIPEELRPVYLDISRLKTERACVELLQNDQSCPTFPLVGEITLYVSNSFDVFYNFTHMRTPWAIGNLKNEQPAELLRRVFTGDTFALRAANGTTWAALANRYGDRSSMRLFSLEDYQAFILNRYLEELWSNTH